MILVLLFVFSALAASQSFSLSPIDQSAWSFAGLGDNPTLSAAVGDTLTFTVNSVGHQFAIHNVSGQISATFRWTEGVTGAPTPQSSNALVTFLIPADAPAVLFYQCEFHSPMTGQYCGRRNDLDYAADHHHNAADNKYNPCHDDDSANNVDDAVHGKLCSADHHDSADCYNNGTVRDDCNEPGHLKSSDNTAKYECDDCASGSRCGPGACQGRLPD
jgi:hypothetical protein